MTGTAFSQIIAFITIPIISRIYLPEEFGQLAVVIAFSNIAGVILSLRYETAIMLPKNDIFAFQILIKSIIIALFMLCLEVVFFIIFFQYFFIEYFSFIYLIVICSLINIFYEIFLLWFNRRKRFKLNAKISVLKVISIFLAQIIFVNTEHGIIHGYFYGNLFVFLLMFIIVFKEFKMYSLKLSKRKFVFILKRYKKFPIYSVPASFMNAIANNIQFILVENLFGTSSAGIFSMIIKLIYAPVTLIAGSVNNVVFQSFTKDIVEKRFIFIKMKKITIYLFIVSSFITIIVSLIYKYGLLLILLGDNWVKANDLLIYFLPIIFTSMISKSVSRFAIFEKQEIGLYFQILLMLAVIISIYLGNYFTNDLENTVFIYAISLSLVFIIQLNISFYLAKKQDKKLKENNVK